MKLRRVITTKTMPDGRKVKRSLPNASCNQVRAIIDLWASQCRSWRVVRADATDYQIHRLGLILCVLTIHGAKKHDLLFSGISIRASIFHCIAPPEMVTDEG
jgi:hypothetical protein